MKRVMIMILVVVFGVGVVAAPEAGAGLFRKNKSKRTEKPEWMKAPRRYDRLPTMSFHSGVLQQDGWSGWKLGDYKLQFTKDCTFSVDGAGEGYLDAGRSAIVMGQKFGDTVIAWSVRLPRPSYGFSEESGNGIRLKKSSMNTNCGEMIAAPQ